MSNINPYNIDGTFPVAGQDNSSQGFRDNFTNIKNNFLFAQNEINDLQGKVLVTSALTGQSLNNDMAGTKIIRPQLDAWTQTIYDNGNISTSAILDFNVANFQKITTSGSITVDFINWPASTGAGALGYGLMRVWIVVTDANHTVTLPANVNIGDDDLAGYVPHGVLTFDAPGNYIFDISSIDSGDNYLIFDLVRNRTRIRDNAVIEGNVTILTDAAIGGDASITGMATIGGDADIGGMATIGSDADIGGNATVGGYAIITTTANIGSDAGVGGNATISGFAHIGGAATIGGTASIGGNTTINGGLTTNGGYINQGTYVYDVALTGASTIVANTAINTIIIDSVPGVITTANIQLPVGPADRQTIKIVSASQITNANIYANGGALVKWVPADTFVSGNTAISLTYISSSSTWYRS